MKKIMALVLVLVMALGLIACGAPAAPGTSQPAATKPNTTEPGNAEPEAITLKVWAPQEDQVDANSWLPQVQAKFEAAHPEYKITWKNEVCSEGDAKGFVTQDVSAAADVYMFANDQLGALIDAKAISKLGGSYLEQVKNDVSETYVNTVTDPNGDVWGFPVAPNTWFMYYNKDLLTAEDVKSLEACLEKGIVAFEVDNSWHLPAFFFANGCTLFGANGTDAAAGVQFGGQAGYDAVARVVDLVNNEPNFKDNDSGYGPNGLIDGSVAAYFSGSWDYDMLHKALGDKLGAVCPPTVEINGQAKQLKSYAGSKAVAVNPNTANPKAAMQFAAFLASSDSQLLRFQLRGITPAVTALSANPDVAASIVAAAESATMAGASFAQPTIAAMNDVWGPVETLGQNILSKAVNADNIQKSVDDMMALLNG